MLRQSQESIQIKLTLFIVSEVNKLARRERERKKEREKERERESKTCFDNPRLLELRKPKPTPILIFHFLRVAENRRSDVKLKTTSTSKHKISSVKLCIRYLE